MALTGMAMTRVERRPLRGPEASWRLVDRNYRAYVRNWIFFATGFLEPVLYLFSIGVGVGKLLETVEFGGQAVTYAAFVAPGMLAASAMNGAILDSTFNIFFKLKFEKLYDARFRVRRMRLVDDYRGSDAYSMASNNTSAFNCRKVSGTSRWSEHAYGKALDLNPVQNPYVRGDYVAPIKGEAYVDRTRLRKGMVDDTVRDAFASIGWGWGGTWKKAKDYQHFSASGR